MVTVAVAVFDNQRITTRFAVESHRTQSTICRKWLQAEPAPLTPPPRAAAFDPRINTVAQRPSTRVVASLDGGTSCFTLRVSSWR